MIIMLVALYAALLGKGHRAGAIGKSKGTGVLAEERNPVPGYKERVVYRVLGDCNKMHPKL